jgi:prepilin-type N-terminal cleavage/methylation domain-containing protein
MRRAARPGGDAGMTLIEVVVAMTITGVFMAMFTGGVVSMFRSANRTQAVASAQSDVNTAFLRLDREIRYAAGISPPAVVNGDPYVEYVTLNTGTPLCTELRLHVATQQLQRRTWTRGVTPLTPTSWIPEASNVSSAQPFTFTAPDDTYTFQRLKLDLTSDGGGTPATRQTDVTFTAMNTSLTTASDNGCTGGRAIP